MDHALQWLIPSNRSNQVHIDHSALAQLPQGGNLTNVVSVSVDSSIPCDQQLKRMII